MLSYFFVSWFVCLSHPQMIGSCECLLATSGLCLADEDVFSFCKAQIDGDVSLGQYIHLGQSDSDGQAVPPKIFA